MVLGDGGQVALEIPQELATNISGLITLLKALGLVVILYIIFNVINTIINKKRYNEIKDMNNNLEEIKKLLRKK